MGQDKIMKKIINIVTCVSLTIVSIALSGFVVQVLWDSFIVTKFNLPKLTLPEALGIALMVSYIAQLDTPMNYKNDTVSGAIETSLTNIVKSVGVLIIGEIIALWI